MFSQKNYTIIIVTFDSVARVDLAAGKTVKMLHASCVKRSAQADLGSSVRVGLNQGPKKCGKVFVLSDEFWSGAVSMADEIVEAVSADQLEQALALEAEQESGISPFESRLGYAIVSPVDGQTTYWVTQAEKNQLDSIMAELPSWLRNIRGFSSVASSMSPPENTDAPPSDPTPPASYDEIATDWLTRYLSGRSELAVIEMPLPAWTAKQQKQISMLVAIGALAICGINHLTGNRQLAKANSALAQLDMQAKQLRQDLDEGEKSASQFRESQLLQTATRQAQAIQLNEFRAMQFQYQADRRRPTQLLRALAATADSGHWIQKVVMNRTEVVITGIGVDSSSVTRLAERLERELDSTSWRVHPAVMSFADATRLVEFELTLVPMRGAAARVAVGSKEANHVR